MLLLFSRVHMVNFDFIRKELSRLFDTWEVLLEGPDSLTKIIVKAVLAKGNAQSNQELNYINSKIPELN